MFGRNLVPVWVGIILLSAMFLGGQDAWKPTIPCELVEDCDDLNPCTDEGCVDSVCVYTNNTDPCDDGDPCTLEDACSGGVCSAVPWDDDGDTYLNEACGGNDCDDGNANVYPGAPELCDGIDNQCPGDFCYGEVDAHCGSPIPGMASVPCGCFDMGDHLGLIISDELPVHNVCISAFEMDVHEVTNAKYAECVDDGACTVPTNPGSYARTSYYGNPLYDDFPVIWVDWYKAADYCTWSGKRLPTEAEWEYGARGGLSGMQYAWGNTISGSNANYWQSGDPWDNETSEVGYYAANGYGLHDVAGNVWEWVNDWYDRHYYEYCVNHGIVNNPPGPASGTSRGMRGGSWYDPVGSLRVSDRSVNNPDGEENFVGFRCARGGAYGP